uniref:Ribosomal protein S12 n=1 Tax=Ascaris lumbricoides TaxID=6252 RepID=A0A0M3HMF0_ASCLU
MRQYRPIVSRKQSPNKLSDPRGMKSKILFISVLSEK